MHVRPVLVALTASSAAATLALPARADCPPGDWFCDASKQAPATPGEGDRPTPPAPAPPHPAPPSGGKDGAVPASREPSGEPKTLAPSETPAATRRYAINGHANFAFSGNDPDFEATSLQGAGAAFRFRPTELLALDSGFDLVAGRDWNGDDRVETAALFHALLFLNPFDRVEIHALAGFGVSVASVREEQPSGATPLRHYVYFGWDGGFGLEWFITKRLTLGVEGLALVRVRNDDEGKDPEFSDPETHRATSVSVGALIRPGVTYYW